MEPEKPGRASAGPRGLPILRKAALRWEVGVSYVYWMVGWFVDWWGIRNVAEWGQTWQSTLPTPWPPARRTLRAAAARRGDGRDAAAGTNCRRLEGSNGSCCYMRRPSRSRACIGLGCAQRFHECARARLLGLYVTAARPWGDATQVPSAGRAGTRGRWGVPKAGDACVQDIRAWGWARSAACGLNHTRLI
jgi:hypothetical protein